MYYFSWLLWVGNSGAAQGFLPHEKGGSRPWPCSQMLAGAAVSWRFETRAPTFSVAPSCGWQGGTCPRAPGVFSDTAAAFPRSKWYKRLRWKLQCCLWKLRLVAAAVFCCSQALAGLAVVRVDIKKGTPGSGPMWAVLEPGHHRRCLSVTWCCLNWVLKYE